MNTAHDELCERLREAVKVIESPDQQLCCSGYDCGCQGATVGQWAAWVMKEPARAALGEME